MAPLRAFSMLLACVLFVVACADATSAPAPPAPTPVRPAPTARPGPSPASSPSPSASSATPTASPASPATPSPAPSPTPAPASSPTPSLPAVTIGPARFTVELAITDAQKAQGLAGRDSLPRDAGMLFLYEREGQYSYWMRGMRFALDFAWIGGDCTVAEITAGVPPPSSPTAPLPLYTPGRPVLHVLEVNAGEAARLNLRPGDVVRFSGPGLAGWRC